MSNVGQYLNDNVLNLIVENLLDYLLSNKE